MFSPLLPRLCVGTALLLTIAPEVNAADQPQWGQAWTRNMVSEERGLPSEFDPQSGRNVRWTARLGSESHSTPVIADGRVYIGTNNDEPRDPKHQGDRGVLMCFDESDGRLLWQLVVPKRDEDPFLDWPKSGISSPATVEGERVYIMSNRAEVLCLDVRGLANGNDGPFKDEAAHMTAPPLDAPKKPEPGAAIEPRIALPSAGLEKLLEPGPLDADILWRFDLVANAGIWPHDGAHSSILVHGDHLYVNTGTGVDNTHRAIRRPDAPSLIVLEKSTGRLLARDDEKIAPRIFHCTWSSPSLGKVDGRERIFFAAGDGVLRAFEPLAETPPEGEVRKLQKVWEFDPDPGAPKENVHRFTSNRREGPSNVFGMPVVVGDRLFFAGGGDIWWGKNSAWLKCIKTTGTGDITSSAEVWSYPLEKHVMSTPAVHDGLLYIADMGRKLHCIDAATGERVWTHEVKGECWASPYVADGKVYLGTRRGDFWILAAGREKKVLGSVELKSPVSATATAANGAIYIATMTHLFALSAAPASQPTSSPTRQ